MGTCILISLNLTKVGMKFPINPSGGLEAREYPVGATGVAQVGGISLAITRRSGKKIS